MHNVIHERQEYITKIADFSRFLTFFQDFAFPCQNSAHIGILPSKIGFAFPLPACFIEMAKWVGDLKLDSPTEHNAMDANGQRI